MAVAMGVLWSGGIVVYGRGATSLGELGAFVGFPAMLICSILAGNLLGVLTGEWRQVGATAKRRMSLGVAVLITAVAVLGFANTLSS